MGILNSLLFPLSLLRVTTISASRSLMIPLDLRLALSRSCLCSSSICILLSLDRVRVSISSLSLCSISRFRYFSLQSSFFVFLPNFFISQWKLLVTVNTKLNWDAIIFGPGLQLFCQNQTKPTWSKFNPWKYIFKLVEIFYNFLFGLGHRVRVTQWYCHAKTNIKNMKKINDTSTGRITVFTGLKSKIYYLNQTNSSQYGLVHIRLIKRRKKPT